MSRVRAFCFTWNNYPDDHAEILDSLEPRYLLYGYERAPTTDTPHLQGYLYFSNQRSVVSLRARLPGCHLVCARGTHAQNIVYCTKSGDYREIGERPIDSVERGTSEIDRWTAAREAAKEGRLEDIPADIFMRTYSTIRRIQIDYMPRVSNLEGVCGTWIHGIAGCGKTRAVHSAYPELYQKPCNKWWDGYQLEPVVLIDDFDVYHVALAGELKHWADFAAFIAERKGGSLRIRPQKVFVTSQYTIEEIWQDPQTRDALNRRFTIINKIRDQAILI